VTGARPDNETMSLGRGLLGTALGLQTDEGPRLSKVAVRWRDRRRCVPGRPRFRFAWHHDIADDLFIGLVILILVANFDLRAR
jgi:hypothetical protein